MAQTNEGFLTTELKTAAKHGRVREVQELLHSPGIWVDGRDANGWSALHWAASRGQAAVVALLLGAQAQVDFQDGLGMTPLHWACVRGHAESVRLLTQGAAIRLQVTCGNGAGFSPLHLASSRGHTDCVRWLVKAGADADMRNDIGMSSTHKAVHHRRTEVLHLLLEQAVADPNLQTLNGETPLHTAAIYGHSDAISILINAGADPNAVTSAKSSPLHLAAMMGHETMLKELLLAGCDIGMRNEADLSAAELACCFCQTKALIRLLRHSKLLYDNQTDGGNLVGLLHLSSSTQERVQSFQSILHCAECNVDQLPREEIISDEQSLSMELHSALKCAGFSRVRAETHSALADLLQDFERTRWGEPNRYIVGSYADGWGNSLISLNGATDMDADIDETFVLSDRVFHLKGRCKCSDASEDDIVECENGHIRLAGLASQPATSWSGSSLRPAIDIIKAYRCCTYPEIELLQSEHHTEIDPSVVEKLRHEMLTSPCHLVTAAPPRQEGRMVRISTCLLEKRLMRNISDVQGQVFVLLKYLIKKVLVRKVPQSLKTYHAKTILFYMLDETPGAEWQPCNIISLARQGMQRLLASLQEGSDSDQCMKHFFLKNAWLYLKKGHRDRSEIVKAVVEVIERLPQLVVDFMTELQPLRDEGIFRFNPFLITPDERPRPASETGSFPYYMMSDAVRSVLVMISQQECSEDSLLKLLNLLQRFPESAATTKHSLLALVYIRFDRKVEAAQVLRETMRREVSRGIPCSTERRDSLTVADILTHLEGTNSAFKFCLSFDEHAPKLEFLDAPISRHFPWRMQYYEWYYLNMQALHRCLSMNLGLPDEATQRLWFEEVLKSAEPDAQELGMVFEFCEDKDLLVQIVHKHRSIICINETVRSKVESLIKDDLELRNLSIDRTIETVLADLRNNSPGSSV